MIFFKSKPCIANPYDRKLDMVPYFAPLVTFDLKSKIEKQVRFFVDPPNAFFRLVRQPTFQKMDFVIEISTSQIILEICSGDVGWSKTIAWDPGGALGPLWTN